MKEGIDVCGFSIVLFVFALFTNQLRAQTLDMISGGYTPPDGAYQDTHNLLSRLFQIRDCVKQMICGGEEFGKSLISDKK